MDGNAKSLPCLPMQEEDDSEVATTMFKVSLLLHYLILHKPFLTSAGLIEPSIHLPHFTAVPTLAAGWLQHWVSFL